MIKCHKRVMQLSEESVHRCRELGGFVELSYQVDTPLRKVLS